MDVSSETKWMFWKKFTQNQQKKSTFQKSDVNSQNFSLLNQNQNKTRIETFALILVFFW